MTVEAAVNVALALISIFGVIVTVTVTVTVVKITAEKTAKVVDGLVKAVDDLQTRVAILEDRQPPREHDLQMKLPFSR